MLQKKAKQTEGKLEPRQVELTDRELDAIAAGGANRGTRSSAMASNTRGSGMASTRRMRGMSSRPTMM